LGDGRADERGRGDRYALGHRGGARSVRNAPVGYRGRERSLTRRRAAYIKSRSQRLRYPPRGARIQPSIPHARPARAKRKITIEVTSRRWKPRNRSDTTGYGTTPHRNSSTSFVHTAFRNHAPTTTRSNASHVSGAFMGATSIRIRVPCQWRREGSSPHAKTRVGTTSTTMESDGSSAASRAYWGYFRYRSARIRRNAVPRPMSRARPWTMTPLRWVQSSE